VVKADADMAETNVTVRTVNDFFAIEVKKFILTRFNWYRS
jgi:hypothetical protein